MTKEQIKLNYEKVLRGIKELDKEGKVKLLIATKTQSAEDINYLISLGADLIGENRVNEVREKYELLDRRASLHLIGSLQRNKVKYIYDKVDMIHSVDSLSLAEEISAKCSKINKVMDVLIEVNSGKEEAKGGIMPEDVEEFYASLQNIPFIHVRGLMTMAPRCNTKEEYMKYFTLTKKIFDKLFKDEDDAVLSMGMSESYLYAIEAGANMVRVGSAIFGERN
ncbi:MAG: YggS family pyridoxal phosphate-dependent enzyme [Clostridia bacterium]|nr:YggS family pyridoxal phosphate-dependent enzyme [Clostridia bacterium]